MFCTVCPVVCSCHILVIWPQVLLQWSQRHKKLLVFYRKTWKLKWVSKIFFSSTDGNWAVNGEWKSITITGYNTGLGLPLKWYSNKGEEMRAFKSIMRDRIRFSVIGEINNTFFKTWKLCRRYHFHMEKSALRPQQLSQRGGGMNYKSIQGKIW